MLLLLKLEDILTTILSHDTECFVLEHVSIQMNNTNVVQSYLLVAVLVRCIHYWNDFKR